MICQRNIEAKLPKMFPEEQAAAEAEMAFSDAAKASSDLGNADSAMATFIYDTVIPGMDDFVGRTEDHLDKSDVNAAEAGRLRFKVGTRAGLSACLMRFGNELSDLVLTYAGLANRAVTLSDDPEPSSLAR